MLGYKLYEPLKCISNADLIAHHTFHLRLFTSVVWSIQMKGKQLYQHHVYSFIAQDINH